MLESLKKKLLGDKQEEKLEEMQENVELNAQDNNIEMATQLTDALANLADAQQMVASLNAVIAEKETSLQELAGKVEALQAYAEKAEAEAKAIAEEAKMKEVEGRKAMLADVIGKDNPGFAATFSAVEQLDEASFNVVISGFAASFAKEAESKMFTEQGVSGEAEVVEDDSNATMRILKQTYNK